MHLSGASPPEWVTPSNGPILVGLMTGSGKETKSSRFLSVLLIQKIFPQREIFWFHEDGLVIDLSAWIVSPKIIFCAGFVDLG